MNYSPSTSKYDRFSNGLLLEDEKFMNGSARNIDDPSRMESLHPVDERPFLTNNERDLNLRSNSPREWHHSDFSALWHTGGMLVLCLLEVLMVIITFLIAPDYFHELPDDFKPLSEVVGMAAAVQCVACPLVVFATLRLASDFRYTYSHPGTVFKVFIATIAAFAGIYFFFCAIDRQALVYGAHHHKKPTSFEIGMRCLYFSMATMTGTGYGDIMPNYWGIFAISLIQMLTSTTYALGFFVISMHQFREKIEYVAESRRGRRYRSRSLLYRTFKWLRTYVPGLECVRKFTVRYLLIVSILVELTATLIFLGSSKNPFGHPEENKVAISVAIIIRFLELVMILLVSLRLVQKYRTQEVSVSFLVQSFLSTAMLFAGIYLTFMLINPRSFYVNFAHKRHITSATVLFFYFSITTQTGTGYGDIYPNQWYSQFAVTIHLLISFFYQVVILGLGMGHIIKLLPGSISDRRHDSATVSRGPILTTASGIKARKGAMMILNSR
ncbi:hypothetical protein AAMO2058_000418000 [Amorphochlora amoebiformis]